uniref:E3 ubiquitin-protein ligase RNF149 n=1 Tax=Myxine glutinosa TaxID=7769 RepID=UPI00358EBCC3
MIFGTYLRCYVFMVALLLIVAIPGATMTQTEEWYSAFLNITSWVNDYLTWEYAESGHYGRDSPKEDVDGQLVTPTSCPNACCGDETRFFPEGQRAPRLWVALVERGGCTFREKILLAKGQNATAVLVSNNVGYGNTTVTMTHAGTGDIVALMIPHWQGLMMQQLMLNSTAWVCITCGAQHAQYIRGPSVVFVSISFILLMVVSLAWLIFYYFHRLYYATVHYRNQRLLEDAAKKAISQLPSRTIKKGDRETEADFDSCAVCIEGYKSSEEVRVLPCKHFFHKNCVDPWLINHRTCPMCKLDILDTLGIKVRDDETTAENLEQNVEAAPTTSSSSDDPSAHTNCAFVEESTVACSQSSKTFSDVIMKTKESVDLTAVEENESSSESKCSHGQPNCSRSPHCLVFKVDVSKEEASEKEKW